MSNPLDTFYFIPHTHWEGAVFQTRAEYLELGLPNILRALRLLAAHPGYRFTLDQVCYVKPFLERYPKEADAFRRFVDEGRLAIVGGTDVMLDVNMPGGESFVRQVLYGKGYFRDALGVEVTAGWALDTFGHHAQMPQLLKLAGFTSYWFARGVAKWELPSEFQWEGLDGTRILACWLPHSYALTYGSPDTLPAFTDFFTQRYGMLAPHAAGPARVGLAGADVCRPEAHVPALVDAFNAQPDRPFELRLAVPADYIAAVMQRPTAPTIVDGELNPIFQGIYSSRIELKQRTRALETLLTTAESLGALLGGLGIPTDQSTVWRARERRQHRFTASASAWSSAWSPPWDGAPAAAGGVAGANAAFTAAAASLSMDRKLEVDALPPSGGRAAARAGMAMSAGPSFAADALFVVACPTLAKSISCHPSSSEQLKLRCVSELQGVVSAGASAGA